MTTLDRITPIRELPIENKRVFIRVDFNVPLEEENGKMTITDDARIVEALPTIKHAMERGARVILASHLGRPKGKPEPDLSLRPVAERLEELLERRVVFLAAPFDGRSVELVLNARGGETFLLENLRFEPGETANDPDFARRLAGFGELFVQDAFGSCHRAHASTVGVTEHLDPCVAGRLVERELAAFSRVLDPEPPFVAPSRFSSRSSPSRSRPSLRSPGCARTFFPISICPSSTWRSPTGA